MELSRVQRRFLQGFNSLFKRNKHNNRKSTRGRVNQYVDLKDENGNYTGRQRLIRHYN